jgi:hypothetical protein
VVENGGSALVVRKNDTFPFFSVFTLKFNNLLESDFFT